MIKIGGGEVLGEWCMRWGTRSKKMLHAADDRGNWAA